ncbi:MAG: glycosyltransferase family 4 protein [Acidimicrobiales bacterium]
MSERRVVMGLLFFPRGGSAMVCRYLSLALEDAGWSVSLVAGSLGAPGETTHAPTFFTGIDLHHLDYTPALRQFEAGGSALEAPVPMHPSYEDREGAPDAVLAAVDPALVGHLAAPWEEPFGAAGTADAEVLHLHHLTPQHDAAVSRWPHVPVVTHLHGTEIKLMESIEERMAIARALGTSLARMPEAESESPLPIESLDDQQVQLFRTTRWAQWRHGEFWLAQMRRQAREADHLITVSPPDRATAVPLLRLDADRVTDVPNGVDTEHFRPQRFAAVERRAQFRRWLVEDPQGWDEGGPPGSVRYREGDLDRLLGASGDAAVLVFVGRFTAAKRVPLLIEAFVQARAMARNPVSLLVWGGHPDEWEGEHPVTVSRRVGAEGVFFAGWRGHHDLPDGLAACDALVMPSVNDSYPQTPLEAMAVGLPVIATRSGGFPSMINLDPAHPTGWLVAPDDVEALAEAIVEAVDDPGGRRRRGAAALVHARAELSWAGRVAGVAHAYSQAQDHHGRRARPERR